MALIYAPLFLYLALLLFYIYTMQYFMELDIHLNIIDDPELRFLKTYNLCYFTIWNFIFQIIFILLVLLDESLKIFCNRKNFSTVLGKVRALFFHSAILPSSVMVACFFWILWNINEDLMMPRSVSKIFPLWLNHVLHSSVIIAVVIELILPKRDNFVEFKSTVPIVLIIFFSYNIVLYSIYFLEGVWLYPIYRILSWPLKISFSLLQFVAGLSLTKVGINVQNLKRPKLLKFE
ncbi:unnamed protein product [Diabrotica balteata]|uniref:Androgen-dependent TFPI-regulating protein n=1 Tax=Diabrotica balteata TaxID=107213 RepID=A0A9N9T5J2_DIABA|nr:unnamed protein product [Diabrotica balteata]